MSIKTQRQSTLALKRESAYGTDPTLAATDVIEHLDDFTPPGYKPNMLERNVVRNTYSKLGKVRGSEMEAGGAISLELHGSGTGGTAPEAGPLLESAYGLENLSTAGVTEAGWTTTSGDVGVGEGVNFAVGDAVVVLIGTVYEVSWITIIATDTLTVSPAFSGAPGTGVAVGAGAHYKHAKADLKSFFMSYWLGDYARYDTPGCKVTQLAMDFTSGELIKPAFTFMAQRTEAPDVEAYTLGDPAYDDAQPLVARDMVLTVGGTSFPVSNIAVAIDNEIFKKQAVTGSGISDAIFTGRTVTGSFSLLYEDKTIEDAFRADTTAELIVVAGDTPGNMAAFRFQKIRYTETPVTVDSGLYKYDVAFDAEMTAVTGEDESSAHIL